MMDFLDLVQTFRLTEGDPMRLTMGGMPKTRGGRYDFVIMDEADTRVLHVRNPIAPEETQA
jgi:hypothetical protein